MITLSPAQASKAVVNALLGNNEKTFSDLLYDEYLKNNDITLDEAVAFLKQNGFNIKTGTATSSMVGYIINAFKTKADLTNKKGFRSGATSLKATKTGDNTYSIEKVGDTVFFVVDKDGNVLQEHGLSNVSTTEGYMFSVKDGKPYVSTPKTDSFTITLNKGETLVLATDFIETDKAIQDFIESDFGKNLDFAKFQKENKIDDSTFITIKHDAGTTNLESKPSTDVKPGVEELFDSNPELADQVYKALGFKNLAYDVISLDIISEESESQKYNQDPKQLAINQGVVYRGVSQKSQYTIKDNGDLVLHLQPNFNEKTKAISLTPYRDTALDYATRSKKGNSKRVKNSGIIIEIYNKDLIQKLEVEAYDELSSNTEIILKPDEYSIREYSWDNRYSVEPEDVIGEFVNREYEEVKELSLGELLQYKFELNAEAEIYEYENTWEGHPIAKDDYASQIIQGTFGGQPLYRVQEIIITALIAKKIKEDFNNDLEKAKNSIKDYSFTYNNAYGQGEMSGDELLFNYDLKNQEKDIKRLEKYLNGYNKDFTTVTPQQKQQALQLYSQYLDTGKQDIEGFKNFVKNQSTEQDQKESDNTKSDMDMTISDIQEKLNVPLENLPKAIAQRILDKDKNLRSAYMVLQEYLKLNDPLVDFNSWFNQNYMLSSDSDYAKNLLMDLETDMYDRAYEYEQLSNYSEQNVPGLTMVESFIHAYNVKVRAEDFDQYGDRNLRIDGGPEFNLKYIRSDAKPLDAIAQELSSMFRFESLLEGQARGYGEDVITPQDIIDYIIERESDPDRFNGKTEKQIEKRRKEIERSVTAKEAYSIAMSLPILESSIDKLYRMKKLTTEQKDIIAEYIEYKLKNKGKRILPMPVENQEDTYLAKALSDDQDLDSIFTDNSPWKTDPLEKESSYLDEPSEAKPGEQLSFFSEGDTVLNNKGQKVAKTKSESDSKQLALNLNDGVSLEQAAQLYLKDSYDLQNALTFSKMMHIAFDKSDYETMSEFLLSKDGKKALKNVAKKILSANVIEQVFDSGVIEQETTTPSIESVATIQEKFSRSTLEAFVYSQEALKQIHLNLENTQESSNLSLEDSISKDLTEIFTCFLT